MNGIREHGKSGDVSVPPLGGGGQTGLPSKECAVSDLRDLRESAQMLRERGTTPSGTAAIPRSDTNQTGIILFECVGGDTWNPTRSGSGSISPTSPRLLFERGAG